MARRKKLESLVHDLESRNIRVILVQLAEAHTTAWPINFEGNRHTPQLDFADRCSRAVAFESKTPYEVMVDGWDNEFEIQFRAWPDAFFIVDSDRKVLEKSIYYNGGTMDAVCANDYAWLLSDFVKGKRKIGIHGLDMSKCKMR